MYYRRCRIPLGWPSVPYLYLRCFYDLYLRIQVLPPTPSQNSLVNDPGPFVVYNMLLGMSMNLP